MNTKRHKPRIFYYYGNENGASSLESPVARSSPGEIVGITAESVYTKQRFLDLTTRALELFGTDKPTCLEVIALLAGKDGVAGTDTGITINSSLEDIQKYLQKVETTNYSAANLGGDQATLGVEIETLGVPKSNLTNPENPAQKAELMRIISDIIF